MDTHEGQHPDAQRMRAEMEPASNAPRQVASLDRLPLRGRIEHCGYIQSVTHLPQQERPALIVTVIDRFPAPGPRPSSIAYVRLLFMGQKQVPGIAPGVRIRYSGMLSRLDHIPTIHNPRYLILPPDTES